MTVRGFSRRFKPLELLSSNQLEAIYQGTLKILWETGGKKELGELKEGDSHKGKELEIILWTAKISLIHL